MTISHMHYFRKHRKCRTKINILSIPSLHSEASRPNESIEIECLSVDGRTPLENSFKYFDMRSFYSGELVYGTPTLCESGELFCGFTPRCIARSVHGRQGCDVKVDLGRHSPIHSDTNNLRQTHTVRYSLRHIENQRRFL